MAFKINGMFFGELNPTITVGGAIEIYENIWPDPYGTIEKVEQECLDPDSGSYWTQAETIGHGAFQTARTNKLLPITYLAEVSNNALLQNIHNQFNALLISSSNSYVKRFKINERLYHEGYSLLKYSGGQEYKQHYDGDTGIGRAITAICYLNDNYQGGEIEFPYFKLKIKPQPGMLMLFPSNYAYSHIAHPVTDGVKYALVTWIRDRET
jgi:hypothetical protein